MLTDLMLMQLKLAIISVRQASAAMGTADYLIHGMFLLGNTVLKE